MKSRYLRICSCVCMAILGLPHASAELIYGIAAVGNATNLITWDSAAPNVPLSGGFVSGLQQNETIVGIDFRPSTGQLYALGTSSRLYTLNTATAVATPVGAVPFAPPLNGFNFGFTFEPAADLIRITSDTNKNFVVDPNSGLIDHLATDLAYPALGDPNSGSDPNVVHIATRQGVLYGIDARVFPPGNLVTISGDAGVLTTINATIITPSGLTVTSVGGFDVSPVTGLGYAALLSPNESASRFYRINLTTNTIIGGFTPDSIAGGVIITAMAVEHGIPEPATLSLLGVGLIGCTIVRRRVG
jgi:hypothetical protein